MEHFMRKWRMKVNTSKYEDICFTNKFWRNVQREGINLHADLQKLSKTTRPRNTNVTNKKRMVLGKTACIALTKLPFSTANKLLLYKSIYRPVIANIVSPRR
ncbi:hypothetical protein J6590_019712 [Homalodisca vitripennis]|nr:hypothetical protein J6590_019712 [Homalodisca vitripennis]